MNPIETAISAQRADSIAHAVASMGRHIERELAKLAEAGGVVGNVYRQPCSTDSRETYSKLKAQRNFLLGITAAVGRESMEGQRVADDKAIERQLAKAAEYAAESFAAYVAKLTAKVGEGVEAAEVSGKLWDSSTLAITRSAGAVEHWRTQMIVNCSALGKLFNQWPTRQVKARKAAQ